METGSVVENKKEEIKFDADINELMNLIVNAFYSKNEIFLRELLSNSSDALEKIRYESLTDKSVLDCESQLKIKVSVDSDNNMIIIEDTGIGMTKGDLINNLGTIAKSGTKSFIDKIKSKDIDQIGQFGVGFYSCFLVADNVKLYTKNVNDKEYIWESNSDKTYTITENDSPILNRGTQIHLHIKEDQKEFLDINTLKDTIKRYTQFINFPIELLETKEVEEEVEEVEEEVEEEVCEKCDDKPNEENNEESENKNKSESNKENDEPEIEELDENEEDNEEKEKTKKTIKKMVKEWNIINDQKPIWCKKPEEVSDEEYSEFYKSITSDYTKPLAHKHFYAEGQIEFNCLLYIPERAPFNIFEQESKKNNIKLYVKKIFIMDDCEDLIPEWLKFVKGVVDSNDIPLNVSREILQQNKILKKISKVVVKKCVELFTEISQDEEKYKTFYDNYNKMLKLGVHEDSTNRDKLIKLLRFYSYNNQEKYISLDDYVKNMKEGQESIYYITGQNKETLITSPFIENLKENGYDVLFFTDPIDEYMIQNVKDYEEKKLMDVSKEGLDFNKEKLDKLKEENKEFIEFVKSTLDSRVTEVKISDRLKSSPCILVTAEHGWSANMERIIKAQALRNDQMDQFMGSRKIMEINLDHIIIKNIKNKYTSNDENVKRASKDIVLMLYDTSLLNSGFQIENPSYFVNKVNKMIEVGFCSDEQEKCDDEQEKNDDIIEKKLEDSVINNEISEEKSEMEQID